MNRTTKEVFESHLQLRLEGKVDEDIEKNYASDVVLLSSIKKFTGKDGVKESADDLRRDIGDAKFYHTVFGGSLDLIQLTKINTKHWTCL